MPLTHWVKIWDTMVVLLDYFEDSWRMMNVDILSLIISQASIMLGTTVSIMF